MPRQTIENRVETLERRVTAVEELPGRMDRLEVQIVQLRAEMHDEFSAIREEIRAGDENVLATVSARIDDARREARVLHEDAIARIAVIGEGLAAHDEKIDGVSSTVESLSHRVDGLSHKVDGLSHTVDGLSEKVDATRSETKGMFEQLMARFDGVPRTPPKRRRSKKKIP